MNDNNFGKIIFKFEGADDREVCLTDSDEIDVTKLTDMFVGFALAVGYQMGSIENVFESWVEERKRMKENENE